MEPNEINSLNSSPHSHLGLRHILSSSELKLCRFKPAGFNEIDNPGYVIADKNINQDAERAAAAGSTRRW